MQFHSPIPILRIFEEAKAREHYAQFLGFEIDWEHRFGENFPIYLQISRGACVIHLSEHYGDASPGSALRIRVDGLNEYHKALQAKDYKYSKPGIEEKPWGDREMQIMDPFGNKLAFYEPKVPGDG